MLGRVAAVFLSLSLFSSDSPAQCNYPARYSGQFRSTVYDVAVEGSFIWTATGYGVQLLEPTSRGPEVADAVALPGSTRVVAPRGNDLAYAGSGSTIFVLRRSGRSLEIVRSVSAPGRVNDLELTSTHLFAATANGIAHYDLLDATNPVRTSTLIPTSRPNVTSLAAGANTLYAVDGDATVEVFNISIPALPQRTGTLDTLPRPGAVHLGTEGFVYVSDEIGQNTDIFSGTTLVRRVPYGSLSFAPAISGALFVAGGDRTLRALDLSDPARPAELYERQLAPTGGTNNGIYALVRSGNTLYVAAGDIGLLSFDVSSIVLPYPMLHYTSGGTSSALIVDGSIPKAYFTTATTLTETSLQLNSPRTASAAGLVVHDSRGSDLVASSGASVRVMSADAVTSFETTLRANVTDAVVLGDTITALLSDGSVWSVKTTTGSTPQQVDTGGAKISYLARSASSYALAEIKDDGTTVVHAQGKKFPAEGAATGGLALNATHAAFFTFRGLNLVDLSTGVASILPSSTGVFPRQLVFAGTDLLVLGERTLQVWNTSTRTLTRSHVLPASGVSISAGAQRAAIATDEGMLVINYLAKLPDLAAEPGANRYYTKVVAAPDRLYLFSSDGVDAYSTVIGLVPKFIGAVNEPGLIDLAATADALYTLAGDGTVRRYSQALVETRDTVVQYGTDPQPLAMFTAGDAVWVSFSTGCRGGAACEKWTMVLDPNTLVMTHLLTGGAKSVAVSGTRAYALLDVPGDLLSLDISNPRQPSQPKWVPAPPNATSIAATGNSVLILGDRLHRYDLSLKPSGDFLEPSTVAQQQIAVAGNCAVVIGRSDNPQLFDAESLIGSSPLIQLPSVARSIAVQGTRLYILTEHSIEVWAQQQPSPARRRPAR